MSTGIHEIASDKDDGKLSPSNHGHRNGTVSLPTHQVDKNNTDVMLCSGSQRDDQPVISLKNVKEVCESTGGINDGKLSPSNHGHRTGTVSPPTHQDGLSNIPQQQCEEQNKPSDAVFKTVTLKAQDNQGISENLDKMTSSQNKGDSICVYLGSPEIHIDIDKMYQEGRDFEITEEIKKGSVFTARDKTTQRLHVLKKISLSDFRKKEIQAVIALQSVKDVFVPEIYLFYVRDNSVHIHMELIENAITLKYVMDNMCSLYPYYIWPFSRFILLEMLAIVNAMHEQNITHGDLHAANILLQKLSNTNIRFVFIDFGKARESQKDMEDLAEIGNHLEIACISKRPPSFLQLSKSERDELHNIIIKMGQSTTDVQRILQTQLNQKDKGMMLQAVIPILSQDPDTSSFKPLGESAQAEFLNHDDIQNIPQEEKLRDKGLPLEEEISKHPSPPDDFREFQSVHESSREMAFLEASTTQTPSNRETPVAPLSRSTEKWGDETKMTGQKESQAAKDSLGINTNATSDQEENHGTPQPAVEAQSPQVNGTLQSPLNVIFPRASGTKVERAEREGSQNWL